MSENGFDKPAEVDDLRWAWDDATGADTAGAVPSTPGTSRTLNGFSPAVPDVPNASHDNWVLREITKAIRWMAARFQRHFSTLQSAIAAVTIGHIFWIDQDDISPRGKRDNETAETAASEVVALDTDGEQVYYSQNTAKVSAAVLGSLGAPVWTVTPEGSVPNALVCDGVRVCVSYPSGATSEIHFLDPADGTAESIALSRSVPTSAPRPIAANGDVVAFCASTNARSVEVYDPATVATIAFPLSYDGSSGRVEALCMDYDHVYACGTTASVGHHVVAWLTTGALAQQWTATIAASGGTPAGRDICTDGERVYVVGDRITDGADNFSIWCFSRENGELLWRRDDESGVGTIACSVDDRVLCVVDSDGGINYVCKQTGALLHHATGQCDGDQSLCSADGLRFIASESDAIVTFARDVPAKAFYRSDPSDVHRKPFYNLAVPATEQ